MGLSNPPVGATEPNIGVEEAPDQILAKDFLKHFRRFAVSKYHFSNPEEAENNYWGLLAHQLEEFKNLINESLEEGQTQVVIGGDNGVTFSSLLAALERFKAANVGYIQFDSHGEVNSIKGSPSHNFHGMYLRPFLADDFEGGQIKSLVTEHLPLENVLTVGNLNLDGDEPEFFGKFRIKNISRKLLIEENQRMVAAFKNFLKKYQHIHINFDIDVFDESLVNATGLPTKEGFFKEDVFPLLEIISKHPSISVDLVEVNPDRGDKDKTIELTQEVLTALLK